MATSLTDLTAEVYRRLGDKQYAAAGVSTFASVAAVTKQINNAIRALVRVLDRGGIPALDVDAAFLLGYDYPVQVLTVTGVPTGGTFAVHLANGVTSAMTFNESAADLQAALRLIDPFTTDLLVVTGSDGGPWTLTWPLLAVATRHNIPLVTVDAGKLTGGTTPDVIVAGAGLGSIEVEIEVDHWLRDVTGAPNYSGHLDIARVVTGTTNRAACYFPRGGRFRKRFGNSRGLWFNVPDAGLVTSDAFYLRGPKLGLVDTPNVARSYVANYAPLPTLLVVGSDTLVSIGLRDLEDYDDLIAVKAARALMSDMNSQQYGLLAAEESRLTIEMQTSVHQRRVPSSGW